MIEKGWSYELGERIQDPSYGDHLVVCAKWSAVVGYDNGDAYGVHEFAMVAQVMCAVHILTDDAYSLGLSRASLGLLRLSCASLGPLSGFSWASLGPLLASLGPLLASLGL